MRGVYPITLALEGVQIGEQILQVLRTENLSIGGHFVAAVADNFADAIVIRRQSAERKILMLKTPFRPGPFLPFVE